MLFPLDSQYGKGLDRLKVADTQEVAEESFRVPDPKAEGRAVDWSPVLAPLKGLKAGSKVTIPLHLEEELADVVTKELPRALAGLRRSLVKYLSKVEIPLPGGQKGVLGDYVEVGYLGSKSLGVRRKPSK